MKYICDSNMQMRSESFHYRDAFQRGGEKRIPDQILDAKKRLRGSLSLEITPPICAFLQIKWLRASKK